MKDPAEVQAVSVKNLCLLSTYKCLPWVRLTREATKCVSENLSDHVVCVMQSSGLSENV